MLYLYEGSPELQHYIEYTKAQKPQDKVFGYPQLYYMLCPFSCHFWREQGQQ